MSKALVKFNKDTHVGKVNKAHLVESLPEGVTEEIIDKVDVWRGNTGAQILNETRTFAEKHITTPGEGLAVSVPNASLLGHCNLDVTVSNNFVTTYDQRYESTDAMKEALEKASSLWQRHNVDTGVAVGEVDEA